MMYIADVFIIAAKNIRASIVRTWLTAFSIAIGVASVMLILSLGASGRATIEAELDKLGIYGLTVYSKNTAMNPLSVSDVQAISEAVDEISHTLPLVVEYGSYRMKNQQGNAVIWGVGEAVDKVMNFNVLYGRLPNDRDIRFEKNVAVIDSELAEKVYRRKNIVGKDIVLNFGKGNRKFEIIGIISPQKDGINQITGGIIPDFVYIPYTTSNRIRAAEDIHQIAVQCISDESADAAGDKAVDTLNRLHNTTDGYSAENLSGHVNDLKSIASLVAMLLGAIAAISLCVSGLGIMNTMLSSASERKKEIGICMAIGAKRRDITFCFLAESVLIAAIGGSIGALGGIGISCLLLFIFKMPFVFSVKNLLLIEAVSIFCGIIFAVIPANNASKLDPITALRDE